MKFTEQKTAGEERDKEGGGSVKILLVVLLLLSALTCYLYLFTGLIRPQQEAASPVSSQERVKQPIPSRPGNGSKAPDGTKVLSAPMQPAGTGSVQAPVARSVVAGKTSVAEVSKVDAPAPLVKVGKVAVPAPPVKVEMNNSGQKMTAPAGDHGRKPPQKGSVTVTGTGNAAEKLRGTTPAVTAGAARKEVASKTNEPVVNKTAKPAGPEKKNVAKGPGKKGTYTLFVGEYVMPGARKAAMARLQKAGFAGTVAQVGKKDQPMTRLFISEFSDAAAAGSGLVKLKAVTPDAFLLPENGRQSLFAGSYRQESTAKSEQKRLTLLGFTVVLRAVTVPLVTERLTAGNFPDKETALRGMERLKRAGFSAELVKIGK